MSTFKAVWGTILGAIAAFFLFGFLLPWMISAASTELVLGGIGIVVLIAGYLITIFVNQIKKENNEL